MSLVQLIEQLGADSNLRQLDQQQMIKMLKNSLNDLSDNYSLFSGLGSEMNCVVQVIFDEDEQPDSTKHCIMQIIFDEDEKPDSTKHCIVQVPFDDEDFEKFDEIMNSSKFNKQISH
jgi:hypothetical protein